MTRSAHVDTFARDHLPPREQWPEFVFDRPELQFPPQLNCATELLDRWVQRGQGDRTAVLGAGGLRWSYAGLLAQANRVAHVLVEDMGLVPGNRVLLRGANSPMLAACWLGVVKAGGIAVGTMPLLRGRELQPIVDKAQVTHALCDRRLSGELVATQAQCPTLKHVLHYGPHDAPDELEARMAAKPDRFDDVPTAADDTVLIAFTSGTTGVPKGTMHFHCDVMAACACWPPHVLRARAPCCWKRPRPTRCCRRSGSTAPASSSRRRPPTARWPPTRRTTTCRACASASRPARRCRPRRASCGRTPRAST